MINKRDPNTDPCGVPTKIHPNSKPTFSFFPIVQKDIKRN